MINAKTFINELNKVGIEFYTGVPDSLMSEFSKSLHFDNSHLPSSINVIDNEIIGGIDDGQVLFKNRENLSK